MSLPYHLLDAVLTNNIILSPTLLIFSTESVSSKYILLENSAGYSIRYPTPQSSLTRVLCAVMLSVTVLCRNQDRYTAPDLHSRPFPSVPASPINDNAKP